MNNIHLEQLHMQDSYACYSYNLAIIMIQSRMHTGYSLWSMDTYSIHTGYSLRSMDTYSIHTGYSLWSMDTYSIHTGYSLRSMDTYSIHTGTLWSMDSYSIHTARIFSVVNSMHCGQWIAIAYIQLGYSVWSTACTVVNG